MHRACAALVFFVIALTDGAAGMAMQHATPPEWTTPDKFWFRVTVPGGHEWWTVDAAHGVRERLFDHRRLAIELSAQAKEEFGPLTLPFAEPGEAPPQPQSTSSPGWTGSWTADLPQIDSGANARSQ